jgi:hypothetical protein
MNQSACSVTTTVGVKVRDGKANEAKQLLQNAVELVIPVLREALGGPRKRGVPAPVILSVVEFYPTDPTVFGLNTSTRMVVGEVFNIQIRLRSPENIGILLTQQAIVETLVHEVCHCIHQNHDDDFHSLESRMLCIIVQRNGRLRPTPRTPDDVHPGTVQVCDETSYAEKRAMMLAAAEMRSKLV